MILLDLPDDVILIILNQMDTKSDAIASTCRRMYDISSMCNWIRRRRSARENSRAMTALFGCSGEYWTQDDSNASGFKDRFRDSVPHSWFSCLNYLDLAEDMLWYRGFFRGKTTNAKRVMASTAGWYKRDRKFHKQCRCILKAAKAAGIELPESFYHVMQRPSGFIPDYLGYEFKLGPLLRCELCHDCCKMRRGSGYLVLFAKYIGGYRLVLFLDKHGRQCVLMTECNVLDNFAFNRRAVHDESDIPLIKGCHDKFDFVLQATGFESFWVHTLFQTSIIMRNQVLLWPFNPSPRRLQEYIDHLPKDEGDDGDGDEVEEKEVGSEVEHDIVEQSSEQVENEVEDAVDDDEVEDEFVDEED